MEKTVEQRNKELREILYENACEITFTKVNGEVRVMPCTLKTEIMPQTAVNESHKTRIYNPEVLSVWCTDKNEWRSFRVNNVIDVKILSTQPAGSALNT